MSDSEMVKADGAYRVLARKYRPADFGELIGQEAMVRTLTNAIATGRIAHAFILTGVRGVGKTTTARILARALNCVGPDGKGGPTVNPCGQCEPCRAIAEDRHVDVLEMDAASRTGVDDIRELTDGVRYKPVAARYKIYIIDEVHMLSKAAFNALLKTLEEPPPDVKFIFATTEIHKVPVTVLSRCQRFSLRRVPVELLETHYAKILEAEKVSAEPAAIGLVARAADGSVRDGLSLLDQAIALSAGGAISEAAVRDMLGIADKGLMLDLLETVLRGDAAGALGQLAALYDGGADPVMVVQDLLDLVHFLMRLKLTPSAGEGDPAVEGERKRGLPLAEKLSVPVLTRAWQMLLKGLSETQTAPSPLQAAEMVLVRLAYVADLPAPADVVKALSGDGAAQAPRSPVGMSTGNAAPSLPPAGNGGAVSRRSISGDPGPAGAPRMALAAEPLSTGPSLAPMPQSFAEVVELFDRKREAVLRSHLFANVHLVRFEPG
ncbi:MAG TPA: DNA polymerase III subunit gamma/tau, partial [Stellaceae bacterium]|nr:DNA polymerase III subunit gamma/tau [Stellaceae bacterium]